MKLYEYAAKDIFSKNGIPVPEGVIVAEAVEAAGFASKIGTVVVKAQVTTGGRGRAGGIATASGHEEAQRAAERILGMSIKGLPVKKVLVEEYRKPEKEMYLGITIDRKARRPVIMASTEGGIDIEETAKSFPGKIRKVRVAPLTGLHDYQARKLADSLDRENSAVISGVIRKLYRIFTEYDCTLAEINPLALTAQGIFALDAKIVIDDSALFRQDIETEEEDTLSRIAQESGMSYVGLEGDIGTLVNGAGLSMATLDMINQNGGAPANFMDVRAGANQEQVKTALGLVSSNRNVKAMIVNIFGGLTKCDEVARGIIDVLPGIKVPLVIRLAGTNEEEGRKLLEKHGIVMTSSTEEAAKEVVKLGNPHR